MCVPLLAHWCLFAYNKSWRNRWEDLIGRPDIEMPDKWSLGIGKYLGSWADAADSEDDAMADTFSIFFWKTHTTHGAPFTTSPHAQVLIKSVQKS